MRRVILLLGSIAIASAGCGATPEGTEMVAGDSVAITTVKFNPDGTSLTVHELLTRNQMEALVAQKVALSEAYAKGAAATYDGTCQSGTVCCDGNDLWIFDHDNQTGKFLCLKPGGDDFLPNYLDSGIDSVTWDWTATSMWGGNNPGFYDCWKNQAGPFLSRNTFTTFEKKHIQCHDAPVFGDTTWVHLNP